MPTPGTVTLNYVTLPTQVTPFDVNPTISVDPYDSVKNLIPLTVKNLTVYAPADVFGFQVEDAGYSPAQAVDFTITWTGPTGTPPAYNGTLKLAVIPSGTSPNIGKKLRVTILTKKAPKNGSPLTARKMKKKKPTAKATKVATKAKATKKKS